MNNEKDLTIIEYKKMDLSNSMLIVAFPTVGIVSSIAGRYIIDTQKLEEIGTISSRYFMPTTIIHNGIPSPPVRIYAGKKICGINKSCDQLAVIISEFMPPLRPHQTTRRHDLQMGRKKRMQNHRHPRRNAR
ncbi:MAG: PAC2 family protein [Methanobacteriota archaeon]